MQQRLLMHSRLFDIPPGRWQGLACLKMPKSKISRIMCWGSYTKPHEYKWTSYLELRLLHFHLDTSLPRTDLSARESQLTTSHLRLSWRVLNQAAAGEAQHHQTIVGWVKAPKALETRTT